MTKTLGLIVFVIVLLVPIAMFGAAQIGLFSGTRPSDLGLHNGMLKPPLINAWNVVSSYAEKQAHTDYHVIAPIKYTGNAQAAFKKLHAIVAQSGAHIVTGQGIYLYAEFQTPMLKFIDDVEFVLDEPAGVIQMRSASRLGLRDFGANRKRLEAIRAQFGQR
jgi:uncharacterized protein (DUF1499 family)